MLSNRYFRKEKKYKVHEGDQRHQKCDYNNVFERIKLKFVGVFITHKLTHATPLIIFLINLLQ